MSTSAEIPLQASNSLNSTKEEKLLSALEAGDFQTALQIIPKDNSSEIKVGADNLTPLHYACMHGRTDIATLLIDEYKYKPDTKTTNQCGHIITPMHLAAKHGHVDIINLLLSEGKSALETVSATSSILDHDGNTPLHTAASYGQLTVVKYLIDEIQSSIDFTNNNGLTPLHLAAIYGHLNVVMYLVSNGCSMSPRDEQGKTPLHLAAESGRIDVVKYFITEKKCDPNITTTTYWKTDTFTYAPGTTLLHIASAEGYLNIVEYLVGECECDPLCRDGDGLTPLHNASLGGHINVVKYLINQWGTEPSCKDDGGNTPLHRASSRGHISVVKFLIEEKQCDPMCKNKLNQTPLHAASQGGHINVVKYLIEEQKVNATPHDEKNNTPLHRAALKGQLTVVRFLIEEKQCDPTSKGWLNETPLHAACWGGHINVVKYLIEKQKVNTICQDEEDNTPLHRAALEGQLTVVRFFIEEKQCDPMSKGWLNETPLHAASRGGHINVVKYLIEKQKVNTICQDEKNNTPLHRAALKGQLTVVRFLIEEKQCDPMSKGWLNETPLHAASQGGHINVVKYLIDKENVNTTSHDKKNYTPLHRAALEGQLTVVRFLIEEKQCDPMSKGWLNETPLHAASWGGHINVVKYLIEKQKVNTTPHDKENKTPLHRAALKGQLTVVRFLIEERQCDPMSKGWLNETPLHAASRGGHINVVKYLIEKQKVNTICQDEENNTPLHRAALEGQLTVVRFLIEEKQCDPMSKGQWNGTPLHAASQGGHINVVKYLIEKQKVNTICQDEKNYTPLHRAALEGQLTVVRFFIEEKQCDPMSKGWLNETPLHAASWGGHINVVKYLIDKQKVNTTPHDEENKTPLHRAALKGQLTVVRFLIEEKQCDPMSQGWLNETPLHAASRGGHINVVKYLIEKQKVNTFCQDEKDNTPLHRAALEGQLTVVKFLIEEKQCDPMSKGWLNETPLHAASWGGHINVVKYLIDEQKVSLTSRNANGSTPLHEAASKGQLAVVRFLINANCDPSIRNSFMESPADSAVAQGSKDVALYLISKGGRIRTQIQNISSLQYWIPLSPIVKVCVLGDTSSGKSTLIQKVLDFQVVQVCGSYFKKAGIVATEINSKRWGRIDVYDFTGCEEFHATHEAFLANISEAVILITVDLRKSEEEIKITVAYWQFLLANASGCYYVILVGTHADTLKATRIWNTKKKALQEKSALLSRITETSPNYKALKYVGSVSLNCHMPLLYNKHIHNLLEQSIKSVQIHCEFDYINGSYLNALIHDQQIAACNYGFLMNQILEHTNPELESLKSSPTLLNACEGLDSSGHLFFLKNKESPGESLIIVNQQISLTVHGAIRDNIQEYSTSTGMIRQSSVMSILNETFHHNQASADSALSYMLAMPFCCEVTAQLFSPDPGEDCLFFPDLVSKEKPGDMCQLSAACTSYFEWSLKCTKPNHFFTPRFVQLLHIKMISHFGLNSRQGLLKNSLQRCKLNVWKNGIGWLDVSGVETTIEVTEQRTSVVVTIGSLRDSEIECHKKLLQEILSIKKSVCPEVEAKEYTNHDPGSLPYEGQNLATDMTPEEFEPEQNGTKDSHDQDIGVAYQGSSSFKQHKQWVHMPVSRLSRQNSDITTATTDRQPEPIDPKSYTATTGRKQTFPHSVGVSKHDNSQEQEVNIMTGPQGEVSLPQSEQLLRSSKPLILYETLQDPASSDGIDTAISSKTNSHVTIVSDKLQSGNQSEPKLKLSENKTRLLDELSQDTNSHDTRVVFEPRDSRSITSDNEDNYSQVLPHPWKHQRGDSRKQKTHKQPFNPQASNTVTILPQPSNYPFKPNTDSEKENEDVDIDLQPEHTVRGNLDDKLKESLQERQRIHTDGYYSLEFPEATLKVNLDNTAILTVDSSEILVPLSVTSKDLSSQHITAELKWCFNNSVSDCVTVTKRTRTTYAITFRTCMRGEHELSVKVDGMHIHRSPFLMFAQVDPSTLGKQLTEYHIEQPVALALGPDKQEVRVIEYRNQRLSLITWKGEPRCIHLNPGTQTMVAPAGIAVDNHGCVYIVQKNQTLLKFSTDRQLLRATDFRTRSGIATDIDNICIKFRRDGRLYVCIPTAHKILIFGTELQFIEFLGSTSRGSGRCEFDYPCGVEFDNTHMYVLDTGNNRVQVLDEAGKYCREFPIDEDSTPFGLHIDSRSNLLYTTDPFHHQVLIYRTSGECVTVFGKQGRGPGKFYYPRGVVVDINGFVFVCDRGNNRITVF